MLGINPRNQTEDAPHPSPGACAFKPDSKRMSENNRQPRGPANRLESSPRSVVTSYRDRQDTAQLVPDFTAPKGRIPHRMKVTCHRPVGDLYDEPPLRRTSRIAPYKRRGVAELEFALPFEANMQTRCQLSTGAIARSRSRLYSHPRITDRMVRLGQTSLMICTGSLALAATRDPGSQSRSSPRTLRPFLISHQHLTTPQSSHPKDRAADRPIDSRCR